MMFNALRDGVITAEEAADLKAAGDTLIEKGGALYQALEAAGLLDKAFGDMSFRDVYSFRGDEEYGEEAEKEIRVRLKVDEDSLSGQLGNAFSATSYSEFQDTFRASMKATLKNALITAFLETAAMKDIFDRLGQAVTDSLSDGVVTEEERDAILGIGEEALTAGSAMYDLLDSLGLLDQMGADYSNLGLGDLWRELRRAKEAADELAQTSLEGEISSRLGIDADSFGSNLAAAFDSVSIEEFNSKLEDGVKGAVRNALIQAFLESAAIKPLLDKLSAGAMDALRDGKVTSAEKEALLGISEQIGMTSTSFFELLDELGLGFTDLNDNVNAVTESLTNVPTGFRLALRRYQVDDVNTQPRKPGQDDGGSGNVTEDDYDTGGYYETPEEDRPKSEAPKLIDDEKERGDFTRKAKDYWRKAQNAFDPNDIPADLWQKLGQSPLERAASDLFGSRPSNIADFAKDVIGREPLSLGDLIMRDPKPQGPERQSVSESSVTFTGDVIVQGTPSSVEELVDSIERNQASQASRLFGSSIVRKGGR